ncbi:MAG: nitroreductase [Hyphomicrobiales bacterium]|nr:nitroreductase [Hyphomicrobiales bacterium]
MTDSAIDLLLTRRSVVANKLGDPGPSEEELGRMLTAAARVPDHKKLVPWRFLLFRGEARAAFGRVLEETYRSEDPDPSEGRAETEAARFLRAPVVIAVVSHVRDTKVVPEWEQVLSAGAACQNLLTAAAASGYAAQWITEWYAYSDRVRAALGLAENERVAGFVYVGTAQEPPTERTRPDLDDIVSDWRG